jgi:hypothetical protein
VGERDLGRHSLPPLWLTWDLAGRGRWLSLIRPLLGNVGRQGRALGEAPISLTDHDTDGLTPLGRQALSLRPPSETGIGELAQTSERLVDRPTHTT